MRVESKVYIPENDTDRLAVHVIEVSYFGDNISNIDIFAISQKSMSQDDNESDSVIFSGCTSRGTCNP